MHLNKVSTSNKSSPFMGGNLGVKHLEVFTELHATKHRVQKWFLPGAV